MFVMHADHPLVLLAFVPASLPGHVIGFADTIHPVAWHGHTAADPTSRLGALAPAGRGGEWAVP